MLVDNKSQPLIPMTLYLMNADIHSDIEGYKNPHKPKAKVHTILTLKATPKLNYFAIYYD